MIRLKNGLPASTYGVMKLHEVRTSYINSGNTNLWACKEYDAMQVVYSAIVEYGYSKKRLKAQLKEMRGACVELVEKGLFDRKP